MKKTFVLVLALLLTVSFSFVGCAKQEEKKPAPEKGAAGAPGAPGATGAPGAPAPAPEKGAPGAPGATGTSGKHGEVGTPGGTPAPEKK